MPKVSRERATKGVDLGPVEVRSEELDGSAVRFTPFREDVDATPRPFGQRSRSRLSGPSGTPG